MLSTDYGCVDIVVRRLTVLHTVDSSPQCRRHLDLVDIDRVSVDMLIMSTAVSNVNSSPQCQRHVDHVDIAQVSVDMLIMSTAVSSVDSGRQ